MKTRPIRGQRATAFQKLLSTLGAHHVALGEQMNPAEFLGAVGSRKFVVRAAVRLGSTQILSKMVADDLPRSRRVAHSTSAYRDIAFVEAEVTEGADFLAGVSCPSSRLCVAVDQGGHVVTSSNPGGGSAWWTLTNADGSTLPSGVSCPSISLCVAVEGGDVLTSRNPTGGGEAWTVTNLGRQENLVGVSCPSGGLCVAVDDGGDVITSSNPTGGVAAWKVINVEGADCVRSAPTCSMNGVSCPSVSLCIAVGSSGDVVTCSGANNLISNPIQPSFGRDGQ